MKLTATQKKQLTQQQTELRNRFEDINRAIAAYNESLSYASEFMEEITATIENTISEKSERWQNSEAGESANSWLSELQSLNFSEEIEEIDEPDNLSTFEEIATESE